MIESIIIKNKKGYKIELSLEEVKDLKDELNELDQVSPQPWPTYYPVLSPKDFNTVTCKVKDIPLPKYETG